MGHAHVRFAALTFGHAGEMLAGSLAAGWASMRRRASETWKHLSSASWAPLLGCCRWAPVFLGDWERRMAFWMGLSKWLPSSRRRVVCWIVRTSAFWDPWVRRNAPSGLRMRQGVFIW